jgi:hypothetical protein
MFRFSSG